MLTDAALAALCAETYARPGSWRAGDLSAIYTVREGRRIIAIRGTTRDPRDWLRDLSAMPKYDRDLGFCHAGFLAGALALYRASPLADHDFSSVILTGHSMGGALALLLGAVTLSLRHPPALIVTFGAPRCGSWKLRRLLRRVPLRLYRNGDDPVPDVPWLPALYLHPRALMPIGEPAFEPLADHPIAAYRRALAGQPPSNY